MRKTERGEIGRAPVKTKLKSSWRPLLYTLATMASLALAAGAKWRPR
jgi:hypothetical protein